MKDIPRTDRLFLILHKTGWSIGVTAFTSKEGISWLVFGSKGDHSIHPNGKTQEEAWERSARHLCPG